MSHKERYIVKTGKGKILKFTDELETALKIKEEHKIEGAYIEDKKNPKKHKQTYFH